MHSVELATELGSYKRRRSVAHTVSTAPSKGTIHKTGLATSGVTEDLVTIGTGNHGLGVTEDSGNVKASLALDVHKVRVGTLHQTLLLVLDLFRGRQRVEQVHDQLRIAHESMVSIHPH